jgi:hypothetical protein
MASVFGEGTNRRLAWDGWVAQREALQSGAVDRIERHPGRVGTGGQGLERAGHVVLLHGGEERRKVPVQRLRADVAELVKEVDRGALLEAVAHVEEGLRAGQRAERLDHGLEPREGPLQVLAPGLCVHADGRLQ